jgi:hypothetical protein
MIGSDVQFDAWNPGLTSESPARLLPLVTLYRPENSTIGYGDARELASICGLKPHEMVAFKVCRLVVHELLIRVTADLSVPSGSKVEDLGINFRQMTSALLAKHLAPHMDELVAVFDAKQQKLARLIRTELHTKLFAATAALAAPAAPRRRFFGLFLGAASVPAKIAPPSPDAVVRHWEGEAAATDDPVRRAGLRAVARVVAALLARHGELWGTPELIADIATDLACNDAGSDEIGRAIDPLVRAGAQAEGYALLPPQVHPVIMNTKGASAAGKSTMRPEQKMLARRIGVNWNDFALISPDIWRKQLLDYASLGPHYKYGGPCTGDELHIIDRKLDRYMARKAQTQGTTHLLIDRFRFDSFAPDSDEAGSNLLTRFGHTVYLFFMLTPPEAIVERAWRRGLEVGRYKAVDDLLAHNIEAYTGMPELFFTWALRDDKQVHYEFLDNTVPYGERPRTTAFGWNGELNVLQLRRLLDIERFRRVDVEATSPEHLYADRADLAAERNTSFLEACAKRLPCVNFADADSGGIWLRIERGVPVWADAAGLAQALYDPPVRAGIAAIAPAALGGKLPAPPAPVQLQERLGRERIHTLGQWGPGG